MAIREISQLDWEQKWFAPSFSFISCSYFGKQYYHVCRERWGRGSSAVSQPLKMLRSGLPSPVGSRELKIPCVIGIQVATSLLKNGDQVAVDALKGIVRKI